MDPRTARRALAGAILAGLVVELLLDRTALGANVPLLTAATLGLIPLIGRRGSWNLARERAREALAALPGG